MLSSISLKVCRKNAKLLTPHLQNVRLYSHDGVDDFSRRDIIPLHHIIQEAAQALEISTDATLAVRSNSTIYEDDSACLSQATLPKMTPRTKHIAVLYQWFREYVVSGILCILKVDTNENLADIFTKGLVTEKFTAICKLLCGW